MTEERENDGGQNDDRVVQGARGKAPCLERGPSGVGPEAGPEGMGRRDGPLWGGLRVDHGRIRHGPTGVRRDHLPTADAGRGRRLL